MKRFSRYDNKVESAMRDGRFFNRYETAKMVVKNYYHYNHIGEVLDKLPYDVDGYYVTEPQYETLGYIVW